MSDQQAEKIAAMFNDWAMQAAIVLFPVSMGYPAPKAFHAADVIRHYAARRDWIPVGERLPETSDFVLVVYKATAKRHHSQRRKQRPGPRVTTMWARYSGGAWRCLPGTRKPERITHWMPLPKVPK